MALVLFVSVPSVLMALAPGVAAPALLLLCLVHGTLHAATIASVLGIATFLAATA